MWSSRPRRGRTARRAATAALAALAGLASGCVEHALREGRVPLDYSAHVEAPTRRASEGGLWAGKTYSGSFLFFDQKARSTGDLVTVVLEENMRAEGTALTELASRSSLNAGISSDVGFGKLISAPIRGLLKFMGIAGAGVTRAEGETLNVANSTFQNDYDGDGKTERSGQFTGEMTCRVIEVLPSGLLRVRGHRYVVVNHDAQFITIEGLVRREDIGIDNKIGSTALAEARITYDGLGVIDDKQRPGILARVLDWVYPF